MKIKFLVFLILSTACRSSHLPDSTTSDTTIDSPVALNGRLSIQDSKIVNAKGEAVSFAGNSLFWSNDYYKGHSFYNKDVVRWLKLNWNSSIIRVPMAADPNIHDSYIFDPKSNEEKVDLIVNAAIDLGLYVIIDWHSQHAEDNEAEAVTFFTNMANKYGGYPNVIYEIYNEPLKVSWDKVIKPYSEKVIAAIRKIDPDNIIVVGTPHWSQDVDVVSENPIKGYKNIAYSLHFYAGSHHEWLLNKAQNAIDKGLPIVVTEWGTVNADGDGGVNYEYTKKWMEFCKKNNLTHCNWSVHDKEEGASILKLGASPEGHWSDDDLTESGQLVRDIIRNWSR